MQDQSAIGQVLSCPKCGSMVHVQAPEGWEPPDEAELAARRAKSQRQAVARRPRDPRDSQATLSSDFGDVDSLLDDSADEASVKSPATRTVPRASKSVNSPPVQAAAQQPILPNEQWTSATAQRRRKAFAWVLGILGISLVAVTVITFLIVRMIGSDRPDPLSAAPDPNRVAETGKMSATENPPGNDALPEQPDVDSNKALVSSEDAKDSPSKDLDHPGPGGAKPSENDSVTEDPSSPPSGTDLPAKVGDPTLAPEQPKETAADEKPPFADATLGTADVQSPHAMNTEGSDDASMINEFGNVGQAIFDPALNAGDLRDLSTDDDSKMIGIGKLFIQKPDAIEYRTSQQMDEVIPGLRYDDVTLVEFMWFFSNLTAVPLQLDSRAVVDGRIDPLAKLSVNKTNVAAHEVLREALEPLGLGFRQLPDSPVVLISTLNDQSSHSREFAISAKFAGSDEAKKELVTMIHNTVDPPSWNVNGGTAIAEVRDGVMVVDQTGANQQRIARFMGMLQAAGILQQTPGDPQALQTLASVQARSETCRKTTSTFSQIQNKPIDQVLHQVLRKDGVTVLVDWVSLIPRGWDPRTEIPWPSQQQTIESTLSDIASSMNLAIRPLDDQTFELTTRDARNHATMLQAYPCGKLLEKNLTSKQILKILEDGIAPSLPKNAFATVYFVPQYDCIVALLPHALHVRAERILNSLAGN